MSRARWIMFLVLGAFVAISVVLSFIPWTWHSQLDLPATVAPKGISAKCGAPWGSATIQITSDTVAPVEGAPCGERTKYRIIGGLDVLLGLGGMTLVAGWGRRRAPLVEKLA